MLDVDAWRGFLFVTESGKFFGDAGKSLVATTVPSASLQTISRIRGSKGGCQIMRVLNPIVGTRYLEAIKTRWHSPGW